MVLYTAVTMVVEFLQSKVQPYAVEHYRSLTLTLKGTVQEIFDFVFEAFPKLLSRFL